MADAHISNAVILKYNAWISLLLILLRIFCHMLVSAPHLYPQALVVHIVGTFEGIRDCVPTIKCVAYVNYLIADLLLLLLCPKLRTHLEFIEHAEATTACPWSPAQRKRYSMLERNFNMFQLNKEEGFEKSLGRRLELWGST